MCLHLKKNSKMWIHSILLWYIFTVSVPRAKYKLQNCLKIIKSCFSKPLCNAGLVFCDIWEHCTIGKYSLWSMNFAKKIMDGKNLCLNIAACLPLQIMINLYFQMNISVFQKHTNQFEVSIPYYFLQIKLFIWCSDIFFCITFI